ncbi:hypothetical protein JCM1841_000851 [Sporobolomyces salmonicolor]
MAITLLTAPPPALTPPELQSISASTPATFEGIAPLLRHLEDDVELRIEPALEGFEGGTGSLWVTEEALSFFSPATTRGISLPYPHITLHATSRTPSPCIYCQVEEHEGWEDDDGEAEGTTREMWIVPKAESSLDTIFSTLSYCASLHPPAAPSALGGPAVLSESQSQSQSHACSGQAALFASMGLDPDSMVFADENGQLAGPGLAFLDGAGEGEDAAGDAQWEDVPEEEGDKDESSAGRQRSDWVNPGRRAPY